MAFIILNLPTDDRDYEATRTSQRKQASNAYTLTEQVRDNVLTHGIRWAANRLVKRVPFTIAHFLILGYLPRTILLANGRVLKCP